MAKGSVQIVKKCIFCGQNASSKEHIWSQWMHDMLPAPEPHFKHSRLIYDYHPDSGISQRGASERQGDLRTVRIRVVCRECNQGWMNDLEQLARPFLEPLIQGSPVALDNEQMTIVAQWITLKCFISEHERSNNALTPLDDRLALKRQGKIPAYYRIYSASHNVGPKTGMTRHSNCMFFNSEDFLNPPVDTPKNIQVISLVLGCAFFYIVASRVPNFGDFVAHLVNPKLAGRRIWPQMHFEMVWPGQPILSLANVDYISESLGRYVDRIPKKTWLPIND